MKSSIKYLLLIAFVGLVGCSSPQDKRLNLIANAWIGYSPLFYAKEQGWLAEHDIELATVVSLGESLHLYQTADFDAFSGTQYEYQLAHEKNPNLFPIILFDRSDGGDMVMGNRSLAELKTLTQPVDVYLEINSVNTPVFQDFVRQNGLGNLDFNYINTDQLRMVSATDEASNPTLAVTYIPYDSALKPNGFETLASTADGLSLLVLDALYTTREDYLDHKPQFLALKTLINRALEALRQDPESYYQQVKPYLESPSFDEFQASLNTIQWLNKDLSPELKQRMNDMNFATGEALP